MKKALALAAKGTGMTSPNPMVGAVIVRGDKIIAADYHRKAGTPHAEILVLKKAGTRARGATLFITLEPCCHTDKRTPPCTKSIINSGIKKAVVAMKDPNPKVNGRGLKELASAGIKTEFGLMEKEAKKLNQAFIKFITKKEPFVILKIAESLDGKIAASKGQSKWITGEDSRRHVHKLRSSVDAVLTGIGTVLKDNPSLTSRIRGGKNPYRIIVDTNLRIPLSAKVLKHKDHKTIIAAISNSRFQNPNLQKDYHKKINKLKNLGVQVLIVKAKNGKVDLKTLMEELGKLNIMSLMIEGGSSINASALSDKVVDKVMFFIAPK
ncbi:MAG: bifunctional diaminohydroxyphosphoribosylaminopyrimidine deaminase/5-amino-6-(5-phosphoribosylamino)uracil reductase RibD, partial [Nitrospirae bacterium]|nr:bifunctional diaminohydroxyphosphoribosylaminopyrimidine deaminase/5-amino-6-(5-phosphoribosylamino)uracil reductase RibD [Nitrospirota bacterium]